MTGGCTVARTAEPAEPAEPAACAVAAYARISDAIAYIVEHYQAQPGLEQLAAAAGLSPHHFQRLFTRWAGVSPKKFLQYLTLEHARSVLQEANGTVLETTHATGLSSPGRLHDLFVQIEHMTPGEYRNGGESLAINYEFADSPFGPLFVASTQRGVCHMAFADIEADPPASLRQRFPRARFRRRPDAFQRGALAIFGEDWSQPERVRLHLKGSPFQLKVWECLLRIPYGRLATYGTVAGAIGRPAASRAVGAAVGSNPVAYIIPCHRVIRASGHLGGYRWRPERKAAMVGWEAAAEARDGRR